MALPIRSSQPEILRPHAPSTANYCRLWALRSWPTQRTPSIVSAAVRASAFMRRQRSMLANDFRQGTVGLHHHCFRARERADVDEAYDFLVKIGAHIVHAPREDNFAPGYYSVLFEDPDGTRLEINYVPGKGLLTPGTQIGGGYSSAPDRKGPGSSRASAGTKRSKRSVVAGFRAARPSKPRNRLSLGRLRSRRFSPF